MTNENCMEIETKIQRFVADNFLFSEGVFEYENDTSFLREGIIDSLGVMELVSFVESQYRIPVVPLDVTPENFDSVTKLANYIRSKLEGQVVAIPS
jgi:acyl carrier protein